MAYLSQDRKKIIAANIKAVGSKYGFGGRDITVGVRDRQQLIVNIRRGVLDLVGSYLRTPRKSMGWFLDYVNDVELVERDGNFEHDWLRPENVAEKGSKIWTFLVELSEAIKSTGYYDRSNPQEDYFEVDFFVEINVGTWEKPYQLLGA